MKKLLTVLAVLFAVFFVIKNPGQSAEFVSAVFGGVVGFAEALASGGGQ